MKENIISLLLSNNWNDKVLGIIMMEKEKLTEEILPRVDTDNWCSRLKWLSTIDSVNQESKNVIVNGKLFNVWMEGLGIMRKRHYIEVENDELIYTDDSIDIREIIKQYQEE